MALKISEDTSLKKSATRKSRTRQARGMMFLEAAMLLPMAAVITVGLAYYANAYVTKTRLGDSARVIARAIQDDPGITQGGLWSSAGDLERVISEATGVSEGAPAGFNVTTYKGCNPDLASSSDDAARRHFETAGRYEDRRGVFGDCSVVSKVGERDTRVSIASHATRPSQSQIEAIIPPDGADANGIHPSGRAHSLGHAFGWNYANPNRDPSKPYWVAVVTKKLVRQISLFGWTFGTSPSIVNKAVVRVVPDPSSVTLFQHCTYGSETPGFVATIKPGRYSSMDQLGSGQPTGSMDNQLSSLRIPPGTRVTLYDGENFTGNSITITESAGCLDAFNDMTSSLVVEQVYPEPRLTTEVRFFSFKTFDNDELKRRGGYKRVQIGTTSHNETIAAESTISTSTNGTATPFVTDEVVANHGTSEWGLRCRQGKGWVAITCGLSTSTGGGTDRDLRVRNNGCFSDNEEKRAEGRIHLGCMKLTVD